MIGATEGQAIPHGVKRPKGDYTLPKDFTKGPRDVGSKPVPMRGLVLQTLKDSPGLTARQIAEDLGIADKRTRVSTALNLLEQDGLVFFTQPPDPGRDVPIKRWFPQGYNVDHIHEENPMPQAQETDGGKYQGALSAALEAPTMNAPTIDNAKQKALLLERIAAWPGLHEEVADALEDIAADLKKFSADGKGGV